MASLDVIVADARATLPCTLMSYRLELATQARQQIDKLPNEDRTRIIAILTQMGDSRCADDSPAAGAAASANVTASAVFPAFTNSIR